MTSAGSSERVVRTPPDDARVVSLDPYSELALTEPEQVAPIWFEAGSPFWIEAIGTWGIARYDHVREALRDWESFSSRGGNGIVDHTMSEGWRSPSALIDADPPEHTRSRGIVSRVLATKARKPDFDRWGDEADAIVEPLVHRGYFDAATDLAEAFGHRIVPKELGIQVYRPDLMHVYGIAGGNARFPFNDRHATSAADERLPEAARWVDDCCRRANLQPDGWGAAVHAVAAEDGLKEPQAQLLVRSLVSAGVENTIRTMGGMIQLFAQHPEQWELLRADPSLARNAVEESLRLEGSTYQFFRTTSRDVRVGDYTIPAREKVLLLLAIANRDPQRWDEPNRFDITRRATGHLGLGSGPHLCVGQAVARQEMLALLQSLLKRVRQISLDGEPVRLVNNTARGFLNIPVRVVAA